MQSEITLDVKTEYYLDEDGSFCVDITIGDNPTEKNVLARPNEPNAEGNIFTVESILEMYEEFMKQTEDKSSCCGGSCHC